MEGGGDIIAAKVQRVHHNFGYRIRSGQWWVIVARVLCCLGIGLLVLLPAYFLLYTKANQARDVSATQISNEGSRCKCDKIEWMAFCGDCDEAIIDACCHWSTVMTATEIDVRSPRTAFSTTAASFFVSSLVTDTTKNETNDSDCYDQYYHNTCAEKRETELFGNEPEWGLFVSDGTLKAADNKGQQFCTDQVSFKCYWHPHQRDRVYAHPAAAQLGGMRYGKAYAIILFVIASGFFFCGLCMCTHAFVYYYLSKTGNNESGEHEQLETEDKKQQETGNPPVVPIQTQPDDLQPSTEQQLVSHKKPEGKRLHYTHTVTVLNGSFPKGQLGEKYDLYVQIEWNDVLLGKTKVISNTNQPEWNESFPVNLRNEALITVKVYDKDIMSSELMAEDKFDLECAGKTLVLKGNEHYFVNLQVDRYVEV